MDFNATFNNISKMTVITYFINLSPKCTRGCSLFKSLMTTDAMQIPSLMATESYANIITLILKLYIILHGELINW
jgi:hypothetical protein